MVVDLDITHRCRMTTMMKMMMMMMMNIMMKIKIAITWTIYKLGAGRGKDDKVAFFVRNYT